MRSIHHAHRLQEMEEGGKKRVWRRGGEKVDLKLCKHVEGLKGVDGREMRGTCLESVQRMLRGLLKMLQCKINRWLASAGV